MTKLTKPQARKFFDLVDKTGSLRNGERVVARLQLNAFVIKHGKDACQKVFDDAKARGTRKK